MNVAEKRKDDGNRICPGCGRLVKDHDWWKREQARKAAKHGK